MNESELDGCYATLGVERGIAPEALRRSYMQQSYALIRRGAAAEERDQLRAAYDALSAHLIAHEQTQPLAAGQPVVAAPSPVSTAPEAGAGRPSSPFDPTSFESSWVNALAFPLVAGLAIVMNRTPLGFFLRGFHVWIHEFGHATIGWMTGHRALPLPVGWTPISPEKSNFVYFGLLFLFAVMAVAGVRERKAWPVVLAAGLAVTQAFMTWRLPQTTAEMWIAFGGVGGEFYLSAAMVALFYFEFPEKFKWGVCRYLFLFLGATSFAKTYVFWKSVKRGDEGIPYGSMINGEEDAGGDMNGLHDEFGWSQRDIIYTYNHLADACLVAVVVVYLIFALQLDRMLERLLHRAD